MLNGPKNDQPLLALVAGGARRASMELALEPAWFELAAVADNVDDLLTLPPVDLDVLVRALERDDQVAEDIRRVRARFAACRVVVVGEQDTAAAARVALRAGADGYVAASEVPRRLSLTVAAVLAGQLCVPNEARIEIAPPVLSHREREVLQLAACGMTNSSIAARLYLSESTVKTHLSSSFRKLGVSSRSEAALAIARVADTLGVSASLPHVSELEPAPLALTGVG